LLLLLPLLLLSPLFLDWSGSCMWWMMMRRRRRRRRRRRTHSLP
jgi:hypothetical protein